MKKKKKSCLYNNQGNVCKPIKKEVTSEKCDFNMCKKPCDLNIDKKCECNVKSCIPDTDIMPIESCKPTNCKKKIKEYVCPCECDLDIKCEDKCFDLSKRADELFEKAKKYEKKAMCNFEEARKLEDRAKLLSNKACNLLQSAKKADQSSQNANCSAQELMNEAQRLCCKAKELFNEAHCIENEAKEICENARNSYEKAENYKEQAKYLYNQALKCDEKALKCYKSVGEKIKEFEDKSKKCETLINKCNDKLNYMDKCNTDYHMDKCNTNCKIDKCGTDYNMDYDNCYSSCEEKIINLAPEKNCGCQNQCNYSYIDPMYDMTPMQYMGNMPYQYLNMNTPYIMVYDDMEVEDMNDMWNNYYMYMQKIIKSMD